MGSLSPFEKYVCSLATAAVVFAVVAVALCMTGCKCISCNDPIVNPGINNTTPDGKSGYVPWWVQDQTPNGAGVIVK